MPVALQHRLTHYLALTLIWATLALPNLGAASLWDIDEGLNAEAAREMYESSNWVVPRFNFQLRDAKPALLYWLQAAAYHAFGVNEFAARLPSAVAMLFAALAVYELGRSMFSRAVGILASLALMSCILVSAVAHFANPDALLLACTCLTFLAFWRGFAPRQPGEPPRRAWFIPFGIACGLGMLAKGPVALALPGLVVLLFLAWQGQLRYLLDRRLILGACAFAAVALPWYLMVTIETRGAFARGFFIKNNIERFVAPNNDHRGPIYYHPLVLLVGFAPWSVFVLPTAWYVLRGCFRRPAEDFRSEGDRPLAAQRLLVCWFVAYLVFFSGAATKLPGYTLPLYPALALMSARFLDGWRRGEFRPHAAVMGYSFLWLLLIGVAVSGGLLVAAGKVAAMPISFRPIAELGRLAWLGGVMIVGGALAWALAVFRRRHAALLVLGTTVIPFVAGLSGLSLPAFNAEKAPSELTAAAGACRRDRDLRLGTFLYFEPSLVFYGQREVQYFDDDRRAAVFLACPTPALLALPRTEWAKLSNKVNGRVVASHWDMYRRCEIVVVSNEPAPAPAPLAQR
jgi:4-amino-4-deoxy-L-arabinose transferase-like glycosyltransferase